MSAIKQILLRALTSAPAARALSPLMRGRCAIFMLHRFQQPELGVQGHQPEILRATLGYLRRQRYQLLSLEELFVRLAGEGPPPDRAVAFTVDDGYADQATTGAPIFAEFDCPATTFVTTGFLDGLVWFWWDRIEFVFEQTRKEALDISLNGSGLRYAWSDPAGRQGAQHDFTERCKEVSEVEKLAGILRLAAAAEVDLPERVPDRYAPMTWNQLRSCEQRGMRYGPHTVTHPVLARTGDDQAETELRDSWSRLQSEAGKPVPVFCYPNGRLLDFGSREVAELRRLGFIGGVTGVPGYAARASFGAGPGAPFEVPRFSYCESLHQNLKLASGGERLRELLSGGLA